MTCVLPESVLDSGRALATEPVPPITPTWESTVYVALSVRRLIIGLIGLAIMVGAVVAWSYSVGHRDGVISDRVEVCQSFGATDAPVCVSVNAQN